MRTTILLTCFLFLIISYFDADAQDTLWVTHENSDKYLNYQVESGEDIFILAKQFKVPPARLADFNQTDFTNGLLPGSHIKIPIENYNYYRINSVVKSKPIYHKVKPGESLRTISRLYNIPQSAVQEWNTLSNPNITTGETIQVGWIAYNQDRRPFSSSKSAMVIEGRNKTDNSHKETVDRTIGHRKSKDTAQIKGQENPAKEELAFEEEFEQQTNGYSLSSETGAAVFYPLDMSVNEGSYYAFHQTLPRGTIIKIENPANGQIIYAKIIGALPKISKYHNALIGLSDNAIQALSARDKRMFCKISYR